ncbi:formin-like protein 8 [Brachypodium distachyon]|uniref:formin-like protein 8 n=1 Tax=Brachypodium distachyon TaxID=15368 RepID=UPI00071C75AD|nr:formin-like protein 8 [Brachypodium distachyon]|eukprot:XP_010229914.2 formin-like protein 8 [Brachypodium distachyon]
MAHTELMNDFKHKSDRVSEESLCPIVRSEAKRKNRVGGGRRGQSANLPKLTVHAPPPPPPPLIASAQLDERSCRWPRNPSPPTKLSAAPVPSLRPPLLVRSSTDEAACARPIPCDEEVPRVPDDRQDLTSANPTPACRRRMPRTGFTDDGDASMFSWLRDSDGSSSVGTELKPLRGRWRIRA